jgi:hypothetical protein
MNTLKPAGKSVDWKACLNYVNGRDTAQMLFVMNWDLRQTAQRLGMGSIPLEPPASTTETQVETDATRGDSSPVAQDRSDTPSEVAPVGGDD